MGHQGIGERVGDGLEFVGIQSDDEVLHLRAGYGESSHAVESDGVSHFDLEFIVFGDFEWVFDVAAADCISDELEDEGVGGGLEAFELLLRLSAGFVFLCWLCAVRIGAEQGNHGDGGGLYLDHCFSHCFVVWQVFFIYF